MPYVDHFQYGERRTPLLRTPTNRVFRFYATDVRLKSRLLRISTANCAINRFVNGFYRMS